MSFSFPTPEFGSMGHSKVHYCLSVPSLPGHFPSTFLPDFLGVSRAMSSQLLPALAQYTS